MFFRRNFCKGIVAHINRQNEIFRGLVEDGSNKTQFGWCALAVAFEATIGFWRDKIVYGLLCIEYEGLVTYSDDIVMVIRRRLALCLLSRRRPRKWEASAETKLPASLRPKAI